MHEDRWLSALGYPFPDSPRRASKGFGGKNRPSGGSHRVRAVASRETHRWRARFSRVSLSLKHGPNRKYRATDRVLRLDVVEETRAASANRIEHRRQSDARLTHRCRTNDAAQL